MNVPFCFKNLVASSDWLEPSRKLEVNAPPSCFGARLAGPRHSNLIVQSRRHHTIPSETVWTMACGLSDCSMCPAIELGLSADEFAEIDRMIVSRVL